MPRKIHIYQQNWDPREHTPKLLVKEEINSVNCQILWLPLEMHTAKGPKGVPKNASHASDTLPSSLPAHEKERLWTPWTLKNLQRNLQLRPQHKGTKRVGAVLEISYHWRWSLLELTSHYHHLFHPSETTKDPQKTKLSWAKWAKL